MMKNMKTWKLTELPPGKNVVGCKWVYTKKLDKHSNIKHYKARLVAQGFSQKPGIDYNNTGTFVPVMQFESLQTNLALAAENNWELHQLDMKSAYLNGYLEEEIYMKQPPGFNNGSGRVCCLYRSIYGLKQAGNTWNVEFTNAMSSLDFCQLKMDYCIFDRQHGDTFAILLLWVDDIITITNSVEEARHVEKQLAEKFEIKSLGEPSLILGIQILCDCEAGTIMIRQEHYIESMLDKFGLKDINPVSTPVDPNVKLDYEPDEDQALETNNAMCSYSTLIGSLMYLAISMRPDISFTVNQLAQFTWNPRPRHWTAVKRVFQYLKRTKDYSVHYG